MGTISVSGFMIILTRSGLSTKRSLQTTPAGGSRYVDRRLGSRTWPVREEEGEVWKEWWEVGKGVPWEMSRSVPIV